jgi:hypothetical protein
MEIAGSVIRIEGWASSGSAGRADHRTRGFCGGRVIAAQIGGGVVEM